MENKLKHLEFIQGTISRMASNLFYLKGWTVTLIAALFALSVKDAERAYFSIAFLAVILFWLLDGYFLSLERCYRALYDEVRKKDESQIDFSMDFSVFMKAQRNTWAASLFSKSIFLYYGGLAAIMLGAMYIIIETANG